MTPALLHMPAVIIALVIKSKTTTPSAIPTGRYPRARQAGCGLNGTWYEIPAWPGLAYVIMKTGR